MERFYLIANQTKDRNLTVTRQVAEYLKSHGKQCFLPGESKERGEGFHYTDPSLIPEDIDCAIVLGGDGTLLQAARDMVDRQIPLLGINLGTLGYLADIDSNSIVPALDHLLAGEYELQRRMMLTGNIYRKGRKIAEDIALNDIVIGREGRLRVQQLCQRGISQFLPGGWDHCGYAHRFHRIQSVGGRAGGVSGGFHAADDAAGASYPEYTKHRVPGT